MSDTKTRGRPKSETALTTAERTRRLICKADAALNPDAALSPLPDSVLLLALPRAYRARQTDAFVRIAGELSQRLGLSVATTDIPTDPIPVETTDRPDAFALEPSEPEEVKPLSDRDTRILALFAEGKTSKRGIARQLEISDSTVRAVLSRKSGSDQATA